MRYTTSQEHEALRAVIREFAETEVKPIAFMMDKENEFPHEAIKKLGKMGYMGIPYEKKYGGAGLEALSYAIAVEELSRVDGGTGVILSAHTSLGAYPIAAFGTEEQKKKCSESHKDKKTYNNGIEAHRYIPGEEPPGYVHGQLKREKC